MLRDIVVMRSKMGSAPDEAAHSGRSLFEYEKNLLLRRPGCGLYWLFFPFGAVLGAGKLHGVLYLPF